jgi:hypothetical protein
MRIFILENPDETAYSSVPKGDPAKSVWGECGQLGISVNDVT